MKYDMTFKMMSLVLKGIVKKELPDPAQAKLIQQEYKDIIQRASDIGSHNNLLSSYALAAWFIAMNRQDGLSPERNCGILENGLRSSKLFKAFMGSADGYFSEKKMAFRREWSRQTHEKKYPNDWVVDVLEKSDSYDFGFNYLECGVCKLCRDEGCPELAKYLCRLDFMIVEVMGIHLERTGTLAEGSEYCDFRFSKL